MKTMVYANNNKYFKLKLYTFISFITVLFFNYNIHAEHVSECFFNTSTNHYGSDLILKQLWSNSELANGYKKILKTINSRTPYPVLIF